MNKLRKKSIESIFNKLTEFKERLESIREEEQEAFDNLSESSQEGEKGEAMNEAIDLLDNAVSDLETVCESLEEIFNS